MRVLIFVLLLLCSWVNLIGQNFPDPSNFLDSIGVAKQPDTVQVIDLSRVIDLNPQLVNQGPTIKNGRTYYSQIGETYHRKKIAHGWFYGPSLIKNYNSLPISWYKVATGGSIDAVRYKRGKLYNGGVNDSFGSGNDKKRVVGKCKNGKLEGKASFYEEGKLSYSGALKNNALYGVWTSYTKQGQPLVEVEYQEGNKYPVSNKRYFENSTQLLSESHYKNLILVTEIHYYLDGKKDFSRELVNAEQGIYFMTIFYENGSKHKSGMLQLSRKGVNQSNNGGLFKFKRVGLWEIFNEEGKLVETKMY